MSTRLRMSFGRLCRETRWSLDITQCDLAGAVGVSRSHIAEVETGKVNPSLDLVMHIGDALGLDLELVSRSTVMVEPRDSDRVHAWCSGYVDRRFRGSGWVTAREVEVVHARSHGWIDLLAFHPVTRVLVIVEVKSRIDDIGAIERSLAWYERSAREVAMAFDWRPSRITSWLLALASDEVESAVLMQRDVMRVAFPSRAVDMRRIAVGGLPPVGQRGLALIDPASRRADWLVPTRSDGRRGAAPFRDYAHAATRFAASGTRR
jgi:transcriptional regulator with XRE-family HTH domain